jgi:hypothetical protein
LAKNESLIWIFIVKMLKSPYCCLPFPAGKCRLLENPPSSSENINFANGQTNRILVSNALWMAESRYELENNMKTVNLLFKVT